MLKRLRLLLTIFLVGAILSCNFISISCLADTQSDYDNANADLEALREEQQSLVSELTTLNETLEILGAQIAEIEGQITDKQAEIDELQVQIDDLNKQVDKQYSDMKLRIQYMYENGDMQVITALLSSESIADFLVKSEYIQAISSYDRRMQSELNDSYTALAYCKEVLDDDMDNLLSLKEQSLSKQDLIVRKIEEFQNNIDANSDNILAAESLAKQYEEKLEAENAAKAASSSSTDSTGTALTSGSWSTSAYSYSNSDLAMLSAILECEAGSQSYECLIAVGSVIMNRVESPYWGSTISSVLYSPGQFTPVSSGTFAIVMARGATSRCVEAAQEVLNGTRSINALYFHTYRPASDSGGVLIDGMYFK